MNYLASFLASEKGASKSGDIYPEAPAEPAKPSSAGFAGSQTHTRPENRAVGADPQKSTDTYPIGPAEPAKPAPIPDRSVWRSVVAGWPIARRQEWADLAERHQVDGKGWK